ncbi:bleomycin hydrolase [Tachypleus tridentatus]|uniref:bleomycin hydrolase n=1 Tax=Tachypleus tridentatus TaxID=6853 RepID=UPI003FD3A429
MACVLSSETLESFKKAFDNDQKNLLAQNVCSTRDPLEVCLLRKSTEKIQHVYTHKVECEGKPVTDQKSSGRCWIFACLNVIRLPFVKHYELEEFEFSQAHLFFWDKIERCNYFLNNVVEITKRGEPVDGRLMSFLLHDPTCDGGQWDMLVNLITKHGVMPKKCFPESYSCESSGRMNKILKSKMREYARDLWAMVEKKCSEEDIKKQISNMMEEVYRVVGICLGIPSKTFLWEYYKKDKTYNSVGPITSLKFYEEYVKPHFNVEDKVCLVNDERPENSFGQLYTVDCLGNVVGGRLTIYNNQPMELLLQLAAESIKNNEAVWFGCDVGARFAGKPGVQDLNVHDFKLVFGVDINLGLNKAERLLYGDSLMTHAMVFTAVSFNEEGKPIKWRVENSWGEERGEKGYLMMTSEWFREYVYEIVIDKKFVSEDVMEVFKKEPVLLPAWDPMGALAY